MKYMQFLKFALVGVLNTAVSYIAYLITIYLTNGMYIFGNVMGFLFGTLNAYIWNSKYVFKQRENIKNINKKQLIKTFLSYGATFLLNTFMLYIIVEHIHIPKKIAPLFVAGIIFIVNYLLNRLWVYRKREEKYDV